MATGTDTFVMLPLDVVCGFPARLENPDLLERQLKKLRAAGVVGVMIDVWWGLVEIAPGEYAWGPYEALVRLVDSIGLRLHVVLSFHACGHSVGDNVSVPLPAFVVRAGDRDPGIYYRDAAGRASHEYLSCAVDNEPVLAGRTPLQAYSGFMEAFAACFAPWLGRVVAAVEVGAGPCGELRYPSYSIDRWEFPGVGALQCFDPHMRRQWRERVSRSDDPLVEQMLHVQGCTRSDAMHALDVLARQLPRSYECGPDEIPFFAASGSKARAALKRLRESGQLAVGPAACKGGSGARRRLDELAGGMVLHHTRGVGRLVSLWYAQVLLDHGDVLLGAANRAFARWRGGGDERLRVELTLKLAGVHWWRAHPSRAAEACAGFVPSLPADSVPTDAAAQLRSAGPEAIGRQTEQTLLERWRPHLASRYLPLCRLLARHGARLSFTCLEMRRSEQPEGAASQPELLVCEVRSCAFVSGIPFCAENALYRLDADAFQRMLGHCYDTSVGGHVDEITFLRLTDELVSPKRLPLFAGFVRLARECTAQARRVNRSIAPPLQPVAASQVAFTPGAAIPDSARRLKWHTTPYTPRRPSLEAPEDVASRLGEGDEEGEGEEVGAGGNLPPEPRRWSAHAVAAAVLATIGTASMVAGLVLRARRG